MEDNTHNTPPFEWSDKNPEELRRKLQDIDERFDKLCEIVEAQNSIIENINKRLGSLSRRVESNYEFHKADLALDREHNDKTHRALIENTSGVASAITNITKGINGRRVDEYGAIID
jgi:SMC interacting uncharacterized protein involved in chromosome segregation